MLKLTGNSFRRKDTFYITLDVENTSQQDLVSTEGNELHIRPRYVEHNGVRTNDPEFGRSEEIQVLAADNKVRLKIQVDQNELFSIAGAGEYTLAYGVVQEFVRWYVPFENIVLSVKEPTKKETEECKEQPLSQVSQDKTARTSQSYSLTKDIELSELTEEESSQREDD